MTITYDDTVIWINFCQFRKKHIHAVCIAIGKDQEEVLTSLWFYSTIGIPIFPDMMTRHIRPSPFFAPAGLWLINPPKPCFILKHHSDSLAGILGNDFGVLCFNFFEESCSSSLAAFGCFDLGITLRQP